jgi:outer membrane protein OmpA-like peptidoglycan-associated protein
MLKMIQVILFAILLHANSIAQKTMDSLFLMGACTVYFDSGRSELKDTYYIQIDSLIHLYKSSPSSFFFVKAHTDDVGSPSYNERLSKKRSDAVMDYLLEQEVADTSIKSSFHGEKLRIRLGTDAKSRLLNRRATIQVLKNRPMIRLSGILMDELDNLPVEGKVVITGKDFYNEASSKVDGSFEILAPLNEYVELSGVAENHFIKSQRIKTSSVHENALIRLPLPKAKLGRVFRFENMNFVGGRSILLSRSKPALALLTKYMLLDTSTCIEVAGHINLPSQPKTALDSENHYLSIARAVKIQKKLVEAGVNPDRVLSRGYGNWFMLYPEARSEKHQALNRRVEIVISSCDSTRLIADDIVADGFNFDIRGPSAELSIFKRFDSATFKVDAEEWPETVRKKIASQIRRLKEANRDPGLYTYQELLAAYPSLPD